MKFVGGPMSGLDVPDGLPLMLKHSRTWYPGGREDSKTEQILVIRLYDSEANILINHVYHHKLWFYGLGRELVGYFAFADVPEDLEVYLARQVLGYASQS